MKIKLWGGFHNTAPFSIVAQVIPDGEGLTAWISHGQYQRLTRRMCGLRHCGCGGARRASTDLPPGWRKAFGHSSDGHDSMIAYFDPPAASDNYEDALYKMTDLCVEVEDTGVW